MNVLDNPVNRRNLRFWSAFCLAAALSMAVMTLVVPHLLLLGAVNVIVIIPLMFHLLAGQFEIVKRPRSAEIGNDELVLRRRLSRKVDRVPYQEITSLMPFHGALMSEDSFLHTTNRSFILNVDVAKEVREMYRERMGRYPNE